jgi:hypothetical protein
MGLVGLWSNKKKRKLKKKNTTFKAMDILLE